MMDKTTDQGRAGRRFAYVALALAAIVGVWGLTSPSAQARLTSMLASPTAVATIDIDSVLSQLDERAELEENLQKLGTRLENEVNTMRAELQEMASDLEIFEPGTEEYKELRRKLEITNARARLQEEYAQRVVREEQSNLRRTLFNKIMDATRAYSEQEGWDIVLIDDSGDDANNQMNDEQFGAYIATRSVAYRNNRVDVTDAVATMMNNAYRNNVSP